MQLLLSTALDNIIAFLERLTAFRFWKISTALACTLLSIVFHNPDYSSFDLNNPKPTGFADYRENWKAIYQQSQQPLVAHKHSPGSHQSKMAFRLAPPLIGRLFPSADYASFTVHLFLFQHVLGLLFSYLFLNLLCLLTGMDVYALLLTLGTPFIYLGNSFFWDTFGWFDGIAFFALMAGLYALIKGHYWLLSLFLTIAFWTDERAIVVSPVVFFWMPYVQKESPDSNKPTAWKQLVPYYVATVLAYAAVRWYIGFQFGLAVPAGSGSLLGGKVLLYNTQSIPYSFVNAFSGYWLPILLVIGWAWKTADKLYFRLAMLFIAASVLASYCVLDVVRSLMYLFVWLLLALIIVARVSEKRFALGVALVVAIMSFMAPTLFYMGKTPVLLNSFSEIKRLLTHAPPL